MFSCALLLRIVLLLGQIHLIHFGEQSLVLTTGKELIGQVLQIYYT